MYVKSFVDHVRAVAGSHGWHVPMARGRDMVAQLCFGRPYSACLAAERHGQQLRPRALFEISADLLRGEAAGLPLRSIQSALHMPLSSVPANEDEKVSLLESVAIPKSKKLVFHRVRVEGIEFDGVVGVDGPYITTGRQGVALGVCGLAYLEGGRPTPIDQTTTGWWLCKFSENQARIDVSALSVLGRNLLVREFGIAPIEDANDDGRRFLQSPAFYALVRWVAAHPISARRLASCAPYVPNWHARALKVIAQSNVS